MENIYGTGRSVGIDQSFDGTHRAPVKRTIQVRNLLFSAAAASNLRFYQLDVCPAARDRWVCKVRSYEGLEEHGNY